MENFITWLFGNFYGVLEALSMESVSIINNIFDEIAQRGLGDFPINLVLFSDTPIVSTDAWIMLTLFFSIFYTIIFIVIVWKIIKKVVVKITRWNKW